MLLNVENPFQLDFAFLCTNVVNKIFEYPHPPMDFFNFIAEKLELKVPHTCVESETVRISQREVNVVYVSER
jgi:hypothetical protein